MLVILAIVLLLIFAGAGFAVHVLWWGLIIALIVAVAALLSGNRRV